MSSRRNPPPPPSLADLLHLTPEERHARTLGAMLESQLRLETYQSKDHVLLIQLRCAQLAASSLSLVVLSLLLLRSL